MRRCGADNPENVNYYSPSLHQLIARRRREATREMDGKFVMVFAFYTWTSPPRRRFFGVETKSGSFFGLVLDGFEPFTALVVTLVVVVVVFFSTFLLGCRHEQAKESTHRRRQHMLPTDREAGWLHSTGEERTRAYHFD